MPHFYREGTISTEMAIQIHIGVIFFSGKRCGDVVVPAVT